MKILITGSSGLLGSALQPVLRHAGHDIIRLVRESSGAQDEIVWNPREKIIDAAAFEGIDGVVHLAGEPVVGRWAMEKKARIRDSRVAATRFLCETLAALNRPPRVLFCASATGYYGDRGDKVLCESDASGEGFLAEVCRDWEAATEPARAAKIRVAHGRIGIVLTQQGGALGQMLLPFRLGLGGPFGDGSQWWSWLALDDVTGAIAHVLHDESLSGAFNFTAPQPVTNRQFSRALGRTLRRPAIIPVPAFALRAVMGREAADEILLSSVRVEPQRLIESGYQFRFPELRGALRHILHSA